VVVVEAFGVTRLGILGTSGTGDVGDTVAEACDAVEALVLLEDEREKLKLALLDTVRLDCSDRRELDRERLRFRAS
jgi:hypothetical protein